MFTCVILDKHRQARRFIRQVEKLDLPNLSCHPKIRQPAAGKGGWAVLVRGDDRFDRAVLMVIAEQFGGRVSYISDDGWGEGPAYV